MAWEDDDTYPILGSRSHLTGPTAMRITTALIQNASPRTVGYVAVSIALGLERPRGYFDVPGLEKGNHL